MVIVLVELFCLLLLFLLLFLLFLLSLQLLLLLCTVLVISIFIVDAVIVAIVSIVVVFHQALWWACEEFLVRGWELQRTTMFWCWLFSLIVGGRTALWHGLPFLSYSSSYPCLFSSIFYSLSIIVFYPFFPIHLSFPTFTHPFSIPFLL